MAANQVYEPLIYTPELGDFQTGNVLELPNDFGREANVDVYIDGAQVGCYIAQDFPYDKVSIQFFECSEPFNPLETTGKEIKVVIS